MRHGFTLIETLVVVAIMLVMLSIGGTAYRYRIRAMEDSQTRAWIGELYNAREELAALAMVGGSGFAEHASLYASIYDVDATAHNYMPPPQAVKNADASGVVAQIIGPNQATERLIHTIRNRRDRLDDQENGVSFWFTWFVNGKTKWRLDDTDGNGFLEPLDSWGRPIRYIISHRIETTWDVRQVVPTSYRFVSAGRDGIFDTDDDIEGN